MKTSLFLFLSPFLLLFPFLSLTQWLCRPAVLAWVNRVQGGRISLSMIRAASLMQSYYLHSSADSYSQDEATVTCIAYGVFLAANRSCQLF